MSYVNYKCAQGGGERLDESLKPFLPDHAFSESSCFTEQPPLGIQLTFEQLEWLLLKAGVTVAVTVAAKEFLKKMGEYGAQFIKEVGWDPKRRTFRGLFRRLKTAVLGPDEQTNAEAILAEALAYAKSSGQEVYIKLGLPIPSRDPGTMISVGDVGPDSEDLLDSIGWMVVHEEAVRKAAQSVATAEPNIRALGIGVTPTEAGFSLSWMPDGARHRYSQEFDRQGNSLGPPDCF